MTGQGLLQLAVYMIVLLALAWPLGVYMARVFDGPGALARALCSGRSSGRSTASVA
jgi:K+-transporting ATPase ATPase A chain